MKIKFQCPCGKRLIALLDESGTIRDCPRCHQQLQIPSLAESAQILSYFCTCSQELTESTCASCQKEYPELEPVWATKKTIAQYVDEPEDPDSDLAFEKTQEAEIISGEQIRPHSLKVVQSAFSIKFQCPCGKRIVAPISSAGKSNICKRCEKKLKVPQVGEEHFLGYLCQCGTLLSLEQSACPQCQTPLYEPQLIESPESSPISEEANVLVENENNSSPDEPEDVTLVTTSTTTEVSTFNKNYKAYFLLMKLASISLITSFLGLMLVLHFTGIYEIAWLKPRKDRFEEDYQKKLALDQKFQEELKKASQIPLPDPNSLNEPDPTERDPKNNENEKAPEKTDPEELEPEEMEDEMFPLDVVPPTKTGNEDTQQSSVNETTNTPPKIANVAEERVLKPFPPVELHPVEGLDYEFFKERIQPILAANCSSTECHGGPNQLEPPADENRIRFNYNRTVRFVIPSDPERSALLMKPLANSDGGMPHQGNDVFVRKSAIFQTFVDWIQGRTLENATEIQVKEDATESEKQQFARSKSCLQCHTGIEEMHPWAPMGCVDCHGGDANANSKEKAHILPLQKLPNDERVLPLEYDPKYLRFRNPTDLRVVEESCGNCHGKYIKDFKKSLHGTTAGHLSDGFYETGRLSKKESPFSIFSVQDDDGHIPEKGLKSLKQVIAFSTGAPRNKFETHYADLPRKSCMRCHFWSVGQAVRGRLGQDGDYRAEGCAGCHVPYALDGLSRSQDPTIKKFEPGHASVHQMTSRVPTSTCVSCHYGDASIGLNFRGLSQLIPGMPGGPEVTGTTNQQMNGVFYLKDPKLNPADIHHQRGMNCIDCHTIRDIMGDGNIYGAMEDAVEIECIDCHGSFEAVSTLTTSRGRALKHLSKAANGEIYLLGKVDGKRRRIKQAKNVVTPGHADYNPRAVRAMTNDHQRLECYSCHSGWSINFFGFHFDRNESFTQLDLLSGKRTPGRVTTQEKVFASFKQFYLGINTEGMIAPYMVGFSTMGTVWDKNGRKIMDHRMPETKEGLSGMTMIHHQLHSVQSYTRSCTECHRSSATYGMGSKNYRLARHFLYVVTEKGVESVAIEKKDLGKSALVSTIDLSKAESLALLTDKIQGEAQFGYATINREELAVLYLKNPAFPVVLQKYKMPGIRYVFLSGNILYACCQEEGLYIFTLEEPHKPKILKKVEMENALHCDLSWPYLYVADGSGGLKVVDMTLPKEAKVVAELKIASSAQGGSVVQNQARESVYLVRSFYKYGRLNANGTAREPDAHLVFLADERGVHMINATDGTRPTYLRPLVPLQLFQRFDLFNIGGIDVGTHIDLGSDGGKIPTEENDYVYIGINTNQNQMDRISLLIVKISDFRPQIVGRTEPINSRGLRDVKLIKVFSAPFLTTYALLSHQEGLSVVNVTKSTNPETVTTILDRKTCFTAQVEEMPLDQMISTDGEPLKDISHEGARYLNQEEVARLLKVSLNQK